MDRKRLALIHIVKKELGLSDEEYRAILKREMGVESARDLNEEGFRRLMRFMVRSRYYLVNRRGLTLRQKLYLDHLKQALGWTDEHLANFLHKYFKRPRLTDLTRAEASKAILALTHMSQRHENAPVRPGAAGEGREDGRTASRAG